MLALLMVASTRYFPSTVIATTVTFSGLVVGPSRPISPSSHRQVATGFAPGSIAALRKPCGFSHMSSCQSSASSGGAGMGAAPGPSTDQAYAPLMTNRCRTFRCTGVPPRQPTPYFHPAGFLPGSRSNSSTIVRELQSMVRV
jgi:hypothetical protein